MAVEWISPWTGPTLDPTFDDITAQTLALASTADIDGILTSAGIVIDDNDTDGVLFGGSVNDVKIYSDGTNLIFTKNGSPWFTFNMGSPGTNQNLLIGATYYDYYGPRSLSAAARFQGVGTIGLTTTKAATADQDHLYSELQVAGSADGEMIHVFQTASGKKCGITALGALAIWITNKSGGALAVGDVVVIDTTTDRSVTTTSSAADATVQGVVWSSAPASNAGCWVVVLGEAKVNYTGTAPAKGDALETSATPKLAQATATPTPGATLGYTTVAGAAGVCKAIIGVR